MGNFISHVKPDSVNIEFADPVFAYFTEVLNYFFVICIQLWHSISKCKWIKPSISRICPFFDCFPVMDHKPVCIRRFFFFLQNIQPWCKLSSTMIEHGVHHDPNPMLMRLFYQIFKFFLRSKMRIDHRIICGVIFVVGFCFHNGIQVDSRDSEPFQIRNFFPDSI